MKNQATNNSHKKQNKKRKFFRVSNIWIFMTGFLIISCILFFGIRLYITYQNHFTRIETLSRELINLRSAMNIDSVRQFKIQKILKIIAKYNSSLSSSEAYDIANEIYEMSVKYTNLDENLICALITHESALTWDPQVVSKAGAMGLMQIMPVTGFFLAESEGIPWSSPEDVIFNPIYNIRMGSRFLSMLKENYGLEGGLAAYNGGEKQAVLWLKNGKDEKYLWSETRKYIPAIQKFYNIYQSEGL